MNEKRKKFEIILKIFVFMSVPIIAFYLMEAYEHNPFIEVRTTAQLFNIFIFELIAGILFCILGRAWIALDITLFFAMVFGLINHYVVEFRSTPFVPWDIFSIDTAKNVVKGYSFAPSKQVIFVTLGFVLLMVLCYFLKLRFKLGVWLRFISTALLSGILFVFGLALQNEQFQINNYLYPFLFTPAYMTKVNGMVVTFTMDLAYINVEKPSGYSIQEAKDILSDYETGEENKIGRRPNIIVIMDEAFSDLSVLGEFETNKDYMPFVHELFKGAENTVTGYANVSVCGGNTANSEFEFLTGNTMAFLPTGSIPYQQYIKAKIPTLASYLSKLGYETYAQHPYYSNGWCRNKVYPLMGFENSEFIGDYVSRKFYRDYISDETCFNKIIDTLENKSNGTPAFIFNVTMQNHGSYSDSYDNFTNTIKANDFNNSSLDQYLSLISATDSEFERLIDYFKDYDEDTIVVFFGDHQPNDSVAASILSKNGMNYKDLDEEEQKLRYKVPYVIWANFDIDEQTDCETSLNYLAANMLSLACVETSDYQNFLLELEKSYPVISAVSAKEEEGDKELYRAYKILQYYRLFDWNK